MVAIHAGAGPGAPNPAAVRDHMSGAIDAGTSLEKHAGVFDCGQVRGEASPWTVCFWVSRLADSRREAGDGLGPGRQMTLRWTTRLATTKPCNAGFSALGA